MRSSSRQHFGNRNDGRAHPLEVDAGLHSRALLDMTSSDARYGPVLMDDAGTELLSAKAALSIGGRLVTALRSRGVPPKCQVVFQTRNSAALVAGIYGVLLGGLAPVVISDQLSERETRELLAELPDSMVVSDAMLEELTAPLRPFEAELSDYFCCRPMHFTSGTSGRPKGVWSGWLDSAQSGALASEEQSAWNLNQSDTHLVCGPLSHSAPLRFALNTLLQGGNVVVPRHFNAGVVSQLIGSEEVTTTFVAPVHLQRILDSSPPRRGALRLIAHAGSSCPERLRRLAIDQFGADCLFEFYGSTEGQFTICGAREWLEHQGTVGRARPGRELRIDDQDRIWCKVPAYAHFEYWGDPEKTRAAWNGDWFTVGDLGRIDDDEYLYLEGRRTDLIISGGVNVYPAEIERVVLELPSVESAVAFGVDDSDWGQRVCLAFVGSATVQQVLDECKRTLAPYKCPKSFFKVSEIPRTPSGKFDRSAIPSHFSSEARSTPPPPL